MSSKVTELLWQVKGLISKGYSTVKNCLSRERKGEQFVRAALESCWETQTLQQKTVSPSTGGTSVKMSLLKPTRNNYGSEILISLTPSSDAICLLMVDIFVVKQLFWINLISSWAQASRGKLLANAKHSWTSGVLKSGSKDFISQQSSQKGELKILKSATFHRLTFWRVKGLAQIVTKERRT